MSDFTVGDRVVATLGESKIVGEVSWSDAREYFDITPDGSTKYGGNDVTVSAKVWTVVKQPDPLPTKLGAIIRYNDAPAAYTNSIRTKLRTGWVDESARLIDEGNVKDYAALAGFTVLFEGIDE